MKIVIIGGGFCGSLCARKLEKSFDVTLIDDKDYFEFTPSVPHVLFDYEYRDKIRICHENYLKKTRVIVSKVKNVWKGYVRVEKREIPYDYLIISTGSSYDFPFKSDVVSSVSRSEDLLKIHNKIEKAKTILVVGGGVVGVEVAAELAVKTDKEIKLFHSRSRLMNRYPEKVSEYSKQFLEEKGCNVVLNESIEKHKNGAFFTDNGERIEADLVLLCKGIVPNFNFGFDAKEKDGFLVVDKNMRISKKIYAGGDVVYMDEEKTAQNAREHAKVICENIERSVKGKGLLEYSGRESPMVISLGNKKGILFYKNFVLTGFIPSLMKKLIEKRFIFEYKYF